MCGILEPRLQPLILAGTTWAWRQTGALAGGLLGSLLGLALLHFAGGAWSRPAIVLTWLISVAIGSYLLRSAVRTVAPSLLLGTFIAAGTVRHPWLQGAVVGAAIGAAVGWLLGRRTEHTLDQRDARCVRALRVATAARLKTLEEATARIERLHDRIAVEVAPVHRATALRALTVAADATDRQRQRDQAALWRLNLAEWQNPLQAIQAGWRKFSLQQCDQQRVVVDRALANGESMLAQWQSDEVAATDPGRRAIATLQQLLQACRQLRQAIVLRETAVVAAATPGIRAAFGPDLPADALRQIDLLRDRQDLGDVAAGVADLDEEALRIAAETQAVLAVEQLVPESI